MFGEDGSLCNLDPTPLFGGTGYKFLSQKPSEVVNPISTKPLVKSLPRVP